MLYNCRFFLIIGLIFMGSAHGACSLFKAFPVLEKSIPYCSFGNLPTPIQRLKSLDNVWVKRDDLSGRPFGGNKVRKLEFLLPDALAKGYSGIFVRGYAGSNFVCASSLYAQKCGLDCVCLLFPQRNTSYLRRNLKLTYYWGGQQHFLVNFMDAKVRNDCVEKIFADYHNASGNNLYKIAAGGSDIVGTLGFVNAAFELKEQIDAGILPEPDYIYTTVGSCGTAAGLFLGLRAAGIKSTIVPICIEEEESPTHAAKLAQLVTDACNLLIKADPSFPNITATETDFPVRFEFVGAGYAAITQEEQRGIKFLAELEEIKLDGTYTGKTFAALLHDIERPDMTDKTILFWDSFGSGSFAEIIDTIPYTELPKEFHYFYETPLEDGDLGV